MFPPGTGDLWRRIWEARRRLPRNWSRDPRWPGQVRQVAVRSAGRGGSNGCAQGSRGERIPASAPGATRRGPDRCAEGGRCLGILRTARTPPPRAAPGAAPARRERDWAAAAAAPRTGRRRRENLQTARAVGPLRQEARAAAGPWSLVTRRGLARSGRPGCCHSGCCCCCSCCRCCWVGGCMSRPRPPPQGRWPRTAAPWRSSPLRRRLRRATVKTAWACSHSSCCSRSPSSPSGSSSTAGCASCMRPGWPWSTVSTPTAPTTPETPDAAPGFPFTCQRVSFPFRFPLRRCWFPRSTVYIFCLLSLKIIPRHFHLSSSGNRKKWKARKWPVVSPGSVSVSSRIVPAPAPF